MNGQVKVSDYYVNKAVVTHTQSAANDCTSTRIDLNIQTQRDSVGVVIHQIQYIPQNPALQALVASGDILRMGIGITPNLTDLQDVTNAGLIDAVHVVPPGACVEPELCPIISDYSGMPGGGLLIPGDLIYFYVQTAGFATAVTCNALMYYTLVNLTDKKAAELLGMLFPANL